MSRIAHARWSLFAIGLAASAFGCAKSTSGGGATAEMRPAAGPATPRLSDDQIWSAVEAIHRREVAQARLAEERATTPAVKRFARHLLQAHKDEGRAERDATRRSGLTAEPNPVAAQIVNEGLTSISYMRVLPRAELDRWYIAMELRELESAIRTIDRDLFAQALDAELRAELLATRAHLYEQFVEAQRISSELGPPR